MTRSGLIGLQCGSALQLRADARVARRGRRLLQRRLDDLLRHWRRQAGESTGVSVLVRVPVLDAVPRPSVRRGTGHTVADERQSWQAGPSQG